MCRIVASTPLIQRDAYGQQVRQTFGSIRTQLDQNYGRSDLHDILETGSIWKTSRDWTMSVWQNERFYAATWDGKSGAKLKDGVTDIMLIVTATSSDASMVSVVYELDNFTACQAEEKRAGRGAL